MPDLKYGIDLTPGFNLLSQGLVQKEQLKLAAQENAIKEAQAPLIRLKNTAEAYKAAIDLEDPQMAQDLIFKATGVRPDISKLDKSEVEISIPMGENGETLDFSGNKTALKSLAEGMSENPEFFTDKDNVGEAINFIANQPGVKKFMVEPSKQKEDNTIAGLTRKALSGDKEAEKVIEELQKQKIEVAQAGRKVLENIPTSSPGVMFNRKEGKFFTNDEYGNRVELNSEQVKELALKYKEELPTNDIRVMQQSVPSVKQLIKQSKDALEKTLTGPLAGRWKKAWSSKIGASDPNFRTLQTDINLLQTRLMKMHVGARGGEYIMKHFEEILTAGKDTPDNLKAALDEIENYSNEVGMSLSEQRSNAGIVQPDKKESKPISKEEAISILQEAGGDKNKAREIAKQRGYSF